MTFGFDGGLHHSSSLLSSLHHIHLLLGLTLIFDFHLTGVLVIRYSVFFHFDLSNEIGRLHIVDRYERGGELQRVRLGEDESSDF